LTAAFRWENPVLKIETIANGLQVAAKWFYGDRIATHSFPVIDNQSQVNFVLNKALDFANQLYPIGALTKEESAGKDGRVV
jgi:dihydroorotase